MKDILVSIATRDRPNLLAKALEMVFETGFDEQNFNVQVIVDNDQKEMYSTILNNYPQVIVKYIEHEKKSWYNIFQAQHNEMKKGYYFFMFLPDDISNLTLGWDNKIMRLKHHFKDDLFVLYTQFSEWGRETKMLELAYVDEDVGRFWEQTPIWTYKFGELLYPFMEENHIEMGRELFIADIIKMLSMAGHNRHVACDINYKLICQTNTSKDDFPQYEKMKYQRYKYKKTSKSLLLESVVKKMREYINDS